MQIPTEDDFARWNLNPVTRFFREFLMDMAETAKEDWLRVSWEGVNTDPVIRAKLRERYEVLTTIANAQREYYENEFKYITEDQDWSFRS